MKDIFNIYIYGFAYNMSK